MKTNSLLTVILYGLLIGLITLAGWKACEMKKEKAFQAREQAELSKDLGYVANDSIGSVGSTYADGSTDNATKTAISTPTTSGIEGETPKTTTASQPVTSSTPTAKPPVVAKTDDDVEKTTSKKGGKVRDLDVDSKKYTVIAGSFTQMANARTMMEDLVKKGFQQAEVGRFNRGKFGCAIADQTDSRKTADAVLAKLKAKGFKDAFIKTRK